MSKIQKILTALLKKQNKIVDKLIAEDCQNEKEFKKLAYLKEAQRELDYMQDVCNFYGGL